MDPEDLARMTEADLAPPATRLGSTSRFRSAISSGWAASCGQFRLLRRRPHRRHRRARPAAAADAAADGRLADPWSGRLGIVFGIVAAFASTACDYAMTAFSTSFIAIPGFVVGLVLIYVLGAP